MLIGPDIGSEQLRLHDLPEVTRNIEEFARILSDGSGFALPADHIKIVDPTDNAGDVYRVIATTTHQASDLLLVYFAGHGLLVGDSRELYLSLWGIENQWSGVRFDGVRQTISDNRSAALDVVIIVDCCFSGAALPKHLGTAVHESQKEIQTLVKAKTRVDSAIVMTASLKTRPALGADGGDYTAFSGALLEVLRDGIEGGPPNLDAQTVFDEVSRRVAQIPRAPEPQLSTQNKGSQIVLRDNRAYRPPPPEAIIPAVAPAPRRRRRYWPFVVAALAPAIVVVSVIALLNLYRPTDPPSNVFISPGGSVTSIALEPRTNMLAVAGQDKGIRLFDVRTGASLGSPLAEHTDTVRSVAFSPDGKTLASASADWTVRIWDVATRQLKAPWLRGFDHAVWSVVFSPDGKTFAAAGEDRTILFWDANTLKRIRSPLTGQTNTIWSLAFSPDGKTLASASSDGTIYLWDVPGHRRLAVLRGHQGPVWSVAFSHKGTVLASASSDKTVRLWNTTTYDPIGPPLTGHTGIVRSVAFTPDDTSLISGGEDGLLLIWDPTSRSLRGEPLTGHTKRILCLLIESNGSIALTGGDDETIRRWDVLDRKPLYTDSNTTALPDAEQASSDRALSPPLIGYAAPS